MSATKRDSFAEFEAQALRELSAVIAKQVMHRLGQPSDLQRVDVRWLWENHYRVNIFIGNEFATAAIANSYFLETGSDGDIIASTPAITRQYQ